MIQIFYNGADITPYVSVNRCIHDMFTAGQADTLHLRVNDVGHLWDSWAPACGDKIRVDYDSINTGTMFLTAAKPRNGLFDIFAQSAPRSGYAKQHKAWQKVRLLQIGEEIAERNGLEFVSYGVEDHLYHYILQDGIGDFAFLHKRAQLEGCAFQVYDGRLVLYSEKNLEAVEPAEMLTIRDDGDYEYNDSRAGLYGSCVVSCGRYSGKYAVQNGSNRVYRPEILGGASSDAECERFAAGLLRAANKDCRRGFVRIPILTGYAAGSMIALDNSRAPSWNGPVFLDHVRNDYGRGKSKIFFHKPLEGY